MEIVIIVFSVCLMFGLVAIANFIAKQKTKKSNTANVLTELMPGINCKQCGRKTCAKFAKDLAAGKTVVDGCPYMSKSNYKKAKKIVESERKIKFDQVAFVKCKGGKDCESKFQYVGDNSCATKNLLHSGDKFCPFACLGCGDCAKACPYNAIYISEKGCAVVDKTKCTGCGECVKACPNSLISMVSSDQFVDVVCNNSSKDTIVTRNCKVSCTHCESCIASCPNGAIQMVGGLPKIDNKKCIKCGKCVSACPNHVISRL